ncbi:unnamed protein product [Thlaspi arvense]|uniref:Uncharacterized protein n=1 Tax=Thlaspi arvense TaxID=13288 RepID=A0AAU9SVI3_THLAR|nr:unnamed protein product [Thlaspi arvense]
MEGMSKRPCCIGEGLKKGAWTSGEDKKLISYIHEHGEGGWRDIPEKAVIARHLPQRTDNEIKNYWNTHLKKRLINKSTDSVTHKPLASSNPSPTERKKLDSQEESNPKEQSLQPGSKSPVSLSLSSSFNDTVPEIMTSDETPLESGFLSCKKSVERSSSTSRLLNKVAARASSIGSILSTSIEGTLRSPASSSCLPNSLCQSSEHNKDQDLGTSIDLSIPDYDYSHFLEHFINSEDEAENIGGCNQDLLMSDFPSTLVDKENMNFEDITGWSSYLLDHPSFTYESEQDSDDNNLL